MDKREFLSALEQSLSVLQEDELRDIVDEYEQHIDIKVEKGLTEAEAIADFGEFSQLTAEILEAYHVRADYAADEKKDRGKRKGEGQADLWKSRGAALWDKVKGAGIRAAGCVSWIGRLIARPFLWIWRRCRQCMEALRQRDRQELWDLDENGLTEMRGDGDSKDMAAGRRKRPGEYQESEPGDRDLNKVSWTKSGPADLTEGEESIKTTPGEGGDWAANGESVRGRGIQEREEDSRENTANGGGSRIGQREDILYGDRRYRRRPPQRSRNGTVLWQRVKRKIDMIGDNAGKGIRWIWKMGAAAIVWAVRAVWNGCCILFSLMAAGFGIFSLYCLGVLTVLLVQGYPLWGATLGCLGLVMCAFSAAVLGITLVMRKRRETPETGSGETGGTEEKLKLSKEGRPSHA